MKVLFKGTPTDAEVNALMDASRLAKAGDILEHEWIAAQCQTKYGTHRYRTVISRFKRRMFMERNADLHAMPGVGLKVLPAVERVDKSISDVLRGGKVLRKAGVRLHAVPRQELGQQDKVRADHAQITLAKVIGVFSDARKEIAAPPAYQSLPKTALAGQ